MSDDIEDRAPFEAAELERAQQERGRALLQEIDFGLQVQAFVEGPIGQRLLKDTGDELDELALEMLNLDPDVDADRARMRVIRQRRGVLVHWQELFAGYINAGKAAEVAYHEGEVTGEQ